MDVDGAALVPAGIDRGDRGPAVGVSVLVPAQEVVALVRAHIGIFAEGIAMPHVDQHARERDTRASVYLGDDPVERQDRAVDRLPGRGVGPDVGTLKLLVDVIGTLGQRRHDDARRERAGARDR